MMAAGSSSALCAPSVAKRARSVTIEIGSIPILLRSSHEKFCAMVEQRYANFLNPSATPVYQFEMQIETPSEPSEEDARVSRDGSRWIFERGDFRAGWDTRSRQGWVRQSANPYSIDTVLRICHSLALAEKGGFLVHAASAVRGGSAFVFAGVSGAGKTTISRVAPRDATFLTDEISYIRPDEAGYRAYGTPFAGEMGRAGENMSAPLKALYFLEKGPENRIEPVERAQAVRELMRHILFFAHDADLVKRVFDAALDFVSRARVERLVFTPDARAWELIR